QPVEGKKMQHLRQKIGRLLGGRHVLQHELPAPHHVLQPGVASLHVLEVARPPQALSDRDDRLVVHSEDSQHPSIELLELRKEESESASLLVSIRGHHVLLVALRARPSLRGAPPPPLPPRTPLLLLQTSLLLRTSGLLLLVQSAATARAMVAGVVGVAVVVMEVAAGVVVGAAVEVVAAVGLVAGVGALVAAMEAAVRVVAVEAVGLVVVGLALGMVVLEVASVSSSSVGARPSRPSSFVSGFCSVGRLGAIISAMYALFVSAKGDCYRCAPPDPGIDTAALGASESGTLPGTAPSEALHTFTLDSGDTRYFFRDSTTLTPLPAPVSVRLADPSGDPIVAHSSTILPCPADAMVTTTTPRGQRVSICTCTRTGRHLATFTRPPGSSLYTLATEPSQVAASAQVSASLPPLPPSPAPPCLPCVEGRQRAAPHSSSFPPMAAPLQTLHMDVWGPARVTRQGHECYFMLVVDDHKRYTTVFPLRSKGQVPDVSIP
ncbi:unnamed protein product, partial [Closterium sp. NIES-54]